MLNWIRKRLSVPVPTFIGRNGEIQPLQEGIDELFKERDQALAERNKYYFEVLALRKRLGMTNDSNVATTDPQTR